VLQMKSVARDRQIPPLFKIDSQKSLLPPPLSILILIAFSISRMVKSGEPPNLMGLVPPSPASRFFPPISVAWSPQGEASPDVVIVNSTGLTSRALPRAVFERGRRTLPSNEVSRWTLQLHPVVNRGFRVTARAPFARIRKTLVAGGVLLPLRRPGRFPGTLG